MREWKLVRSVRGPSFKVFSVRTDTVRSPVTRSNVDFYAVETLPCASIIALTGRGEVVMVRQYRHGTREFTLELPGGLVEKGLSPEETAKKELLEETGYRAGNAVLLGKAYPLPAILTTSFYCYFAEPVEQTGEQDLDSTEDIEVVLVPLEKVREYIGSGHINHALVVTSFFWYFERFKRLC
ncbi:MAG: NUDIX hydrolase [Firmicutes bacterium]|nr:NUDIX hydrolase [Bacillota bacterium]